MRQGFRPLAGIMVLIERVGLITSSDGTPSFRPLAGIMVLIRLCNKRRRKQTVKVSVPLRGLWFLSRRMETDTKQNF